MAVPQQNDKTSNPQANHGVETSTVRDANGFADAKNKPVKTAEKNKDGGESELEPDDPKGRFV